MNEFEKYIRKAAEQYSLSADEKARMESVLKSYMGFKPMRGHFATRVTAWTWLIYIHRPIAAALVFVLITSSTAAYAAESALPGDALYTVKTYINEPARVAFAYSAEARAEAHIVFAERRIEEAATLAAEGRLDEDTQNSLAAAFESHAEAVAEEIEHAEAEDEGSAIQLESRFETRLAAHEAVLAEVEFEIDTEVPHSHKLADTIRSHTRALTDSFDAGESEAAGATASMAAATPEAPAMRASKTIDTQIRAEIASAPEYSERQTSRMKSAAENSLENAKKSLRKAKRLSNETKVRAEADLALAAELLSGNSYQKSLRITEQVSVYIKAAPTLEKARARMQNARKVQNERTETKTDAAIEVEAANMAATSTQASSPEKTEEPETENESDREQHDEERPEEEEKPGLIKNIINLDF